MPPGIGYPPAAAPPMRPKRKLTPEEEAMLAEQGMLPEEMPPDAFDFGPGGYANALPPPAASPSPAMEAADPLAGQLFKRFRQTANAPFPGTPGGVGGGPLPDEGPNQNPMRDAPASPFEPAQTAESPMSHVPPLPPSAAPPDFVQDQLSGQKQPRQMPGRIGRRMSQRTQPGRGQTMTRRRGR